MTHRGVIESLLALVLMTWLSMLQPGCQSSLGYHPKQHDIAGSESSNHAVAQPIDKSIAFLELSQIRPAPVLPPASDRSNETSSRAQRQIDDARQLLEEDRYTEAIQRLERALRYSPNSLPAHQMMARVCLMAGNSARAHEHLQQALQLDHDGCEVHFQLGKAHILEQSWPQAILAFRNVGLCGDLQQHAEIALLSHYHLGLALQRGGYVTAAIDRYDSFIAEAEQALTALADQRHLDEALELLRPAHLSMSQLYELLDRPLEAARELTQTVRHGSGDTALVEREAQLYLRAKHFEKAADAAKRLAEHDIEAALPLLVSIRRQARRSGKLMDDLKELSELYADRAAVVRALANEYVAQGQLQSATATLRRFVRAYPSDGDTAATLSALLLQQGAWQESLEVMGAVLESSVTSELAVSSWLDLLQRSGKAKEMLEQAFEHVAAPEAGAHKLYLVARLALRLGERQSAERLLKRCEGLAPKLAAVHLALGQLYVQGYSWQEAIEAAQRAINQNDSDFRAHRLLGEAYLGLDDYPKATAALNSAVRLNRSDLRSNLLLAEVYELSGKRLQAKRQNQIILELDPTNEKAMQDSVLMAFRDQDLDQVRQYLRVLEENKSLQSTYRRCKAALDLIQNEDRAAYAGELAAIIEAYPDDLQARMELAQVRLSGGHAAEAEELLQQIIRTDPQRFEAHDLLCHLWVAGLNYAEAIGNLRSRLVLHPNRIPWQKTLVAALTYDQQFEAASQTLQTFLANPNLGDRDRLIFQYDQLMSLVLADNFDEAVRTLEGLIESPSSHLLFKTILLNLYHSSDRGAHAVALAEEWFHEANLADQNDSRSQLLSAYWADERFIDAEVLMLDWLELDPEAVAPTLALSDTFRRAGRLDDAIELVTSGFSLAQAPDLFWNLVSLHLAADDRGTAIRILRDRLAVEFKSKPPRLAPNKFQLDLRGQLCSNLAWDGRYDVAEQELTSWLQQLTSWLQHPTSLRDHQRALRYHKQALRLLSLCYQLAGKKSLAIQQLEEMHRLDPADIRTNNDLGYTWAAAGMNLDRAEKMIRLALAAQPRSVAYLDSLGWVLYKKGDFAAAYEWLARANLGPLIRWESWLSSENLQRGSDDPVIRDHLGDAAWRLGKEQQAIECWKRALRLVADEKPDELTPEQRTILDGAHKKIDAAKAGTAPQIAAARTDA